MILQTGVEAEMWVVTFYFLSVEVLLFSASISYVCSLPLAWEGASASHTSSATLASFIVHAILQALWFHQAGIDSGCTQTASL